MTITVQRDLTTAMRHWVTVREHKLSTDLSVAEGGADLGPDPHDFYDTSLGACKAVTVLWYAKRKNIPVEDIRVSVERDASAERAGTYKLQVTLHLTGDLTDAQRQELLAVAAKCPVHKLMTTVTTEISTRLD